MHWVRAKRKVGVFLALFALALQLTLSFGHLHQRDIFRATPAVDISVATAGDQSNPAPTHQQPSRTNDYCAICATILLLNSSFAPVAPQPFSLPLDSQSVQHIDRLAAVFITPQRTPLQSRAPPSA